MPLSHFHQWHMFPYRRLFYVTRHKEWQRQQTSKRQEMVYQINNHDQSSVFLSTKPFLTKLFRLGNTIFSPILKSKTKPSSFRFSVRKPSPFAIAFTGVNSFKVIPSMLISPDVIRSSPTAYFSQFLSFVVHRQIRCQ